MVAMVALSKAGTLGVLVVFTHPFSLNKKVVLSLSGLQAPEVIPDLEDSFQYVQTP